MERFSDKAWATPPRLPLGDPYTGICAVDPMREWRPDDTTLRECCNRGYARKKCPRFPDDAGPDAVRFTVSREQNGLLKIHYVVEKDRRPLEHGPMEYSAETGQFKPGQFGGLLGRQAQAYVESYLRRKTQPQDEAHHPSRR